MAGLAHLAFLQQPAQRALADNVASPHEEADAQAQQHQQEEATHDPSSNGWDLGPAVGRDRAGDAEVCTSPAPLAQCHHFKRPQKVDVYSSPGKKVRPHVIVSLSPVQHTQHPQNCSSQVVSTGHLLFNLLLRYVWFKVIQTFTVLFILLFSGAGGAMKEPSQALSPNQVGN